MSCSLLVANVVGSSSEFPLLHFDEDEDTYTVNEPSEIWLNDYDSVESATQKLKISALSQIQHTQDVYAGYVWLYNDIAYGWLSCYLVSDKRKACTVKFIESAIELLGTELKVK
jgi:hypothetical protein